MSQGMERVNELLLSQYDMDLLDVDVPGIQRALEDGEEPQAIVDDIGEKMGLTRKPGSLAKDHIDSLVADWRELMVKLMGQFYADAVSDEDIREWLLKAEEPKRPETDDEADVLMDDLANYIEDKM